MKRGRSLTRREMDELSKELDQLGVITDLCHDVIDADILEYDDDRLAEIVEILEVSCEVAKRRERHLKIV